MKTEEIKKAKRDIMIAIAELKRLYNDRGTTFKEMMEIADFARDLDVTDFSATITD